MAYRAPEYLKTIGHFSDIFSLGATVLSLTGLVSDDDRLWEDVVPKCPFSDELKSILLQMVAWNHHNRFQNCTAVISALNK